jgi:WD40 repeat protein
MTVEEALAIITDALAPIQLNKLQEVIFRQAWDGQSYFKIARDSGYGEDYVKGVGAELWQLLSQTLGTKVSKHTVRSVIAHYVHCNEQQHSIRQFSYSGLPHLQDSRQLQESIAPVGLGWSEAVDVSIFYGRTQELATLKQWILRDRCRLIALLGMGGVGKTVLATKLGEEIQEEFDVVIWQSLRDAPFVQDVLIHLIQVLSPQQINDLPHSFNGLITLFLQYLHQYRCFIVLDNAESILRGSERAGHYREGFEGYGTLIRRIGESHHRSCILLTSREKPKEICLLKGQSRPVRSLQLAGLDLADGKRLLQTEGVLGTEAEQQELLNRYAGNPLAVKIAATTIHELFCGEISSFLAQGVGIFGDICDLLDQQFERITELGKVVMYWLAIHREPVSLTELRKAILVPTSPQKLLETLESLERRSLLERNTAGFTLQNVVMEYVVDRFIEQVTEELKTEKFDLFHQYSLLKAIAKDYIRKTQIHLILKPISEQFFKIYDKQKLLLLLEKIRRQPDLASGYIAGNVLNLLCQQYGTIEDYDFSELTLRQVYLNGIQLHHINFSQAHFVEPILTHTFGTVLCVAFSPDGTQIATGDSNGDVRLWRFADGKHLMSYEGHTNWVRSLAFSPDGKILASGGADQTIRLWDLSTNQCFDVLKGHTVWVWSLVFSSDGQYLISSSDDQTIRFWNIRHRQCVQNLVQTSPVWSIALNPDGTRLASGSNDQMVRLWDVKTGRCLQTLQGHTNWVRSVAFSPDGKILASSGDQTVQLWDVKTGRCLQTLQGHWDQVWTLSFSPDGQLLASGSDDQTIRIWDIRTRQCLYVLQGHTNRIWSVAFSPNGQTLSSSSDDQTIRIWDVKHRQCLRTLQGYSSQIWSVAFSPSGHTLISGSDQEIYCWDVKSRKCLHILQGHTNRIWSVAFSPNGQTFISGSEDRTARLWDVQTQQCLHTFHHNSWIWSVEFSPDGQLLAMGGEDEMIYLWDLKRYECCQTFQTSSNWIQAIAFNPSGEILASSENEAICLREISTGKCVQTFEGHTHQVWSIAFSPNGQLLASGSEDQSMKIWDVHRRQCIHTLQAHTSQVWAVAFSPDGRKVASGSGDQTVKIWDVQTGQCLHTLQGHTNSVHSIAFSANGRTLASASADGTIRLWDVQRGQYVATLKIAKPYEGTDISSTTGLTTSQKASLVTLGAFATA